MKILITESQFRLISEVSGGSNKLSKEEFIKRSQEIHKNEDGSPKYLYSLVDWVDTNTKVKIICPEHKNIQPYFEVFPNKHLQGQGKCPLESKRKSTKHTDEELMSAAGNVNSSIEFETKYPSEYFASRKRDKNKPKFYKEITKHFKLFSESFGEKLVADILVNENLISQDCKNNSTCNERQKTFEGCINKKEGKYCRKLKFDFFIPTQNTVIEYDGEQHFRPSEKFGGLKFETTVENDMIKNQFCFKNGIKLIRIPYNLKADVIQKKLISALNEDDKFQLLGDYPKKGWNS